MSVNVDTSLMLLYQYSETDLKWNFVSCILFIWKQRVLCDKSVVFIIPPIDRRHIVFGHSVCPCVRLFVRKKLLHSPHLLIG